jgi:hypothetical protein
LIWHNYPLSFLRVIPVAGNSGMPDRIYDSGIACRLRCVFYFEPCSLDRICNSLFLFNLHPLIFYKANKSRESMITVARIHYIYTNIWISVNGFILYVVGAGVQGYSIADWRILISHGHTRTDTDDLIDKIYPQITQIAQIIKISLGKISHRPVFALASFLLR